MCRHEDYSVSSSSSSLSSNESTQYSPSNKPLHGKANTAKPVILNTLYTKLPIIAFRIFRILTSHRAEVACLSLLLVQACLTRLLYFRYQFYETVRFNRRTLTSNLVGGNVVPKDAWWKNQKLTIFTVWIGDESPPPVIDAAMQSCRDIHKDNDLLEYRVITNDDLRDSTKLGFELHPSFWLLDNVEKSDYLRGELLHHHGGFYMDADMLCLKPFSGLFLNNFVAGAAQDRTKYGAWPSVSQNAFGPFQPKSELTTKWHTLLMKEMDDITPTLQACAASYEPNPIPYPTSRQYGTSICGTTWGQIIDFCKTIWWDYMKERMEFGHDMSMCNGNGEHLGWDDYQPLEKCDVVHLGTSGDFYLRKQWTMKDLCEQLPVMAGSMHCKPYTSSIARRR